MEIKKNKHGQELYFLVEDDTLKIWSGFRKTYINMTTVDGFAIKQDLAVWDYDWRAGRIDLRVITDREYASNDGWFDVIHPNGNRKLMNYERVRVHHWTTRQPAEEALAVEENAHDE